METGLRLLHFHDLYQSDRPSGETTRVLQEARILADAGHTVSLRVIDNDIIRGWGPARMAALPFRTVWSSSTYSDARRAIARFRPDLIHIHNTLPLASPSLFWAARRAGLPVVHTLANYRLMCPQAAFLRNERPCEDCVGRSVPWPGVVHACYRGSRPASVAVAAMLATHTRLGTWTRAIDVMLIGSEFARQKYVAGGFPPGLIVTKPNTAPDPGRARQGPGRHYLFAGSLDWRKGVDLLIRAWSTATVHPDRELRIAGDGPSRRTLEDLARTIGAERIRFLGWLSREEVADQLMGARALVSPSLVYEVAPVTIVEALAAGVPCVIPTGGAQQEVVRDGLEGLHFPGRDVRGLASAIEALDDDETSEAMGRNARARYEQGYSPSAVLKSLEEGYALARERAERRTA